MTITSRLSQALKLVKAFELFHARATPQGDGFVIGYGHTASAREGAMVTREEAEDLLIYDLGQIGKLLDAWVYAPMHDNQRQALIAFGFNVGAENLHRSTALRRLNAGDYMGCAREIERWRMAELAGRGQVVDALVRRRAAEKALFLTPAAGFLKTDSTSLRPRFDGDRSAPSPKPETPVEATSAAMAAAHNVSARLRALLPDLEAPEPIPAPAHETAVEELAAPLGGEEPDQPELDLAPAIAPTPADAALAQTPVPDRDAAADAALLDSLVLEPIHLAPAPPPWNPSAPPPAETAAVDAARLADTDVHLAEEAAPPPPPPFVPSARLRRPTLVSANDYDPDSFNDETLAESGGRVLAEPPAAAQPSAALAPTGPTWRERLTPLRALVMQHGHLFLGLLGILLFVVSILFILTGKASIANLAIGLVGVLCMTPTAYTLLGSRSHD